jgi:hypothetical protein
VETIYPSKQDKWLTFLVLLSALATALAGVAVWGQPGNLLTRLAVTGVCTLGAIFFIDLLVRTNYTLGRDRLMVRSGVFRWEVPYSAIDAVRPSRTLLSGPALSLDRLAITRNDTWLPLIISPRDQPQFLADLAERDPELMLVDGSLQRQSI